MGSALVRGCSSEKPCDSTHENRQNSKATLINGASANTRRESSNKEKKTGRLRSVVFIQVVPAAMDGDSPPTKHTAHSVTVRLQELLRQLDNGVKLDQSELRDSLSLAVLALSDVECADPSEDDVLNSVSNTQVRAWLATTFTRHERIMPQPLSPLTPKERFKAVANTIIIGKYFENIVREPPLFTGPQYPPEVATLLQEQLDNWEFPIFRLESVANAGGNSGVLRFVGFELFKCHNLFDRCSISPLIFDQFLTRIEADYGSHGNPYHNATHGADVAQTIHYFIQHSSLKAHLTHLDILSLILSALIHDVNHPGTSNAFQIAQMSEYALMYNDRSVLENHHLHHTFRLMREKQFNILSGLKPEEYKVVRGLVIDMVLATDMSTHFEQLKNIKQTLSCSNSTSGSQLLTTDRSKTFSLILHLADISHPGKAWKEHLEWSDRLCEEFFRQGDEERSLGFPVSPLCDRSNTDVSESQLGFIEYIVAPSFDVCGSVFDMIAAEAPLSPNNHTRKSFDLLQDHVWAWSNNIDNNKAMWRERKVCKAKGGCRGSVISKSEEHTQVNGTEDSQETSAVSNGEAPTCNGKIPDTMTTCEVEQLPSDSLVSTETS